MNYKGELIKKDLEYIWHPCSQMKDYEELKPIIIKKGKGPYLYDLDDKKYLDCVSSWWCNLFGHSNERINNALKKQVDKLEHVIFANFSNLPAIELSERLIKLTGDRLNKVFFCDNGSSAVEAAIKMSFHYHKQSGKEKKRKFLALEDAYHGETLGALSMGDLDIYSSVYKPLMIDVTRVKAPNCYRCEFSKDRESCSCECFSYIEEELERNSDSISGVIIEPLVQAAAGMKIYPPIYLKKLRDACDKYDVHFIADEIAVGFGRTGKMFATEHGNVCPDFMCLSKGLTGGYMPMALLLTGNKIYDCFYDDYNKHKAFMHSHTYSGNALGAAIAIEVLNIFEDENILKMVNEKGKFLKENLNSALKNHKNVGEIRTIGMINAIELIKDKKIKKAFSSDLRIGYKIYKKALERGLLLRPLGDVLYFNPPYIITEEDMIFMIETTKKCIEEVLGK
ncbi:adenosylmethionine--8-amino-7-oxononanoate transaminase [Clostridium perfringens]|uniref:adenosylmethionine--8-amino-7-oxononanoate transaminase n=1 Tax=Clostridium perfringens TaxID=1502 RepID=UPI001A2DA48E|nr:adenosylmethionine--8-amino-7-oxononanoate transaminase [Clostridium perfringens]MBO3326949.1 adenosylmethionine--8-amino-7-oxononanoate transaminase [Clostridium perfringens]HAT4356309.1 adenosylmethionine--8-amino-7-oxononanoate transaminase [Clostridium perfringens]